MHHSRRLQATTLALTLAFLTACGGTKTSPLESSADDTAVNTTFDTSTGQADTSCQADSGAADTTSAVIDGGTSPTVDAGSVATDGGARSSKPEHDPVYDGDLVSAQEVIVGQSKKGHLYPTGDVDYVRFSGKKGDVLQIWLSAQTKAFAPESLDTVITLYGPDKLPIAYNDDPYPRTTNDSVIYTRLPADGSYFVRIEECWTYIAGQPAGLQCAEPEGKTETAYTVHVDMLDNSKAHVTIDSEKGNTEKEATKMGYAPLKDDKFVPVLIYGGLEDNKDVDVYAFNVPKDSPIGTSGGKSMVRFQQFTKGKKGNGSTSDVGDAWLTTATAPDKAIALADMSTSAWLATPLEFGKDYLLHVKHPGFNSGDNDFYFIRHFVGSTYGLENDDKANNVHSGAEVLKSEKVDLKTGYSIEHSVTGDIGDGGKDADWYALSVPKENAEALTLTAACSSARAGSGVKGLQLLVHNADGTPNYDGFAEEGTYKSAYFQNMALPKGANKILLKVSADGQNSKVSGAYYYCAFSFVYQTPTTP